MSMKTFLADQIRLRDLAVDDIDKPRVAESLCITATAYMVAIDKANELAAMLRSETLTDNERYEAVRIVSDAACPWCGSLKGRSCQCTNDE